MIPEGAAPAIVAELSALFIKPAQRAIKRGDYASAATALQNAANGLSLAAELASEPHSAEEIDAKLAAFEWQTP